MTLTLVFHAAAAILLLLHRHSSPAETGHETVVSVTLIERRRAVSESRRTLHAVAHHPSPPMPNPMTRAPTSRGLLPTPIATKQVSLDLSIAKPSINFERDPIKPRAERWEATISKLRITMMDNSFGGRLQAMQKSQICGELRAALSKGGISATVVLATMKHYGCRT